MYSVMSMIPNICKFFSMYAFIIMPTPMLKCGRLFLFYLSFIASIISVDVCLHKLCFASLL